MGENTTQDPLRISLASLLLRIALSKLTNEVPQQKECCGIWPGETASLGVILTPSGDTRYCMSYNHTPLRSEPFAHVMLRVRSLHRL